MVSYHNNISRYIQQVFFTNSRPILSGGKFLKGWIRSKFPCIIKYVPVAGLTRGEELEKWLKEQECTHIPPVKALSCELLRQDAVASLEKMVDNHNFSKKTEVCRVKPSHLYKVRAKSLLLESRIVVVVVLLKFGNNTKKCTRIMHVIINNQLKKN